MSEKKQKFLQPRKPVPCRQTLSQLEKHSSGKPPRYYDALPRDCQFAYMTPSYYATGFRILDVYKTEVDFSEYRNLTFLEDQKEVQKWGHLRSRIPYPEGRVTDLPGTRFPNGNYILPEILQSIEKIKKSIFSTNFVVDFSFLTSSSENNTKQISTFLRFKTHFRELNYKNYCLRSLTPESAMSWRKSIKQITPITKEDSKQEEENETEIKCLCDKK